MARAKQAWFGRFTKASNLDFNVHDHDSHLLYRAQKVSRRRDLLTELAVAVAQQVQCFKNIRLRHILHTFS